MLYELDAVMSTHLFPSTSLWATWENQNCHLDTTSRAPSWVSVDMISAGNMAQSQTTLATCPWVHIPTTSTENSTPRELTAILLHCSVPLLHEQLCSAEQSFLRLLSLYLSYTGAGFMPAVTDSQETSATSQITQESQNCIVS